MISAFLKLFFLSLSLFHRIHYLNHVKSEFGSKPEFVRAQYERSIEGCGKGKKIYASKNRKISPFFKKKPLFYFCL